MLFGTCNCPKDTICILPNGIEDRIGVWLQEQRRNHAQNTLAKDRKRRLQTLVDCGWLTLDTSMRMVKLLWNFMFDRLVEFGNNNGHGNVPPHLFVVNLPDGTRKDLGTWVSEQQQLRLEMSSFRRSKLQNLADRSHITWS